MTITSQIITDAFRQGNIIPISGTPTAPQQTEALRHLNRIVKSVFGYEAGENFTTFPIGRVNIERPSGYPWYDTYPDNEWFVPENVRLVCNIDAPLTLYLHPKPNDGSRLAVNDVTNSFATNPLTLEGNGRQIEGDTNVVLDVDGTESEWFFRSDISDWVKYAPIDIDAIFPFPEEFDDFFITMLALRLNPAYGRMMDPQTEAVFRRSKTQIRARYSQIIQTQSELGLIRPARVSRDRDIWGNYGDYYDPTAMFNKGWPY